MKTDTQFVTLDDAARLLNTTGMRVLMMLKRQELSGRQEQDGWYVDAASIKGCATPDPAAVVRPGGCGGGCGSCGSH